jgi:hypothetical protein
MVRPVTSVERNAHHGHVELFDVSLLAAPIGVVVAIAASVWARSLAPIGLLLVGALAGGLVAPLAWDRFAHPNVGVEFGSEFEGYDWVIGFAAVGALIGALLGTWIAGRRRRRSST